MMKNILECQQCGEIVYKDLSPEVMANIVDRPYDHIVYCLSCKSQEIRRERL